MTKRIIAWICTFVVGFVLAVAISFYRGLGSAGEFAAKAMCISDGFFVSGLLFTGIGLLVWISTTGFFDIFGYGVRSLLVLFTILKKPENQETYYEYKAKRDATRKQPVYSILITGLTLIAVSVLFLYLYHRA